jgi:hypothetical protein
VLPDLNDVIREATSRGFRIDQIVLVVEPYLKVLRLDAAETIKPLILY